MEKKKITTSVVLSLIAPLFVFAATIDDLLTQVRSTLNYIIAILFVLVTLYFIWGVVTYISAGGDDEKIKKGKKHMLWGIIGMAVMGAAWGLVRIIWDYLGVSGGGTPPIPSI